MDAEIIFSGLVAFLNIDDYDQNIVGPSVILVQTDDLNGGHNGHGHGEMVESGRFRHIPYLAFDTRTMEVDNATGFLPVPGAGDYMFMPLDGVQIEIENNAPGKLTAEKNFYQKIVRMKDYWPKSEDAFHEHYVPLRNGKPKKHAVKGFLLFGKGTLTPATRAEAAWVFVDNGNGKKEVRHSGIFYEEVVYSDFPHGSKLVIKLTDLESNDVIRKVSFSRIASDGTLKLFVGNHLDQDISRAVRREPFDRFSEFAGSHFAFLNQISKLQGPGPLPKPVQLNPPMAHPEGGPTGGPCGPVGGGGGGGHTGGSGGGT